MPALILVLLGALTKSAQFPFHFWLPHAMSAPTPVSAYLHSATMVKAGVFLLVRFWPVMSGTDEWLWIVTFSGLITLIVGGYAAIFQTDLKGLLAYSTISHLGLITTLHRDLVQSSFQGIQDRFPASSAAIIGAAGFEIQSLASETAEFGAAPPTFLHISEWRVEQVRGGSHHERYS